VSSCVGRRERDAVAAALSAAGYPVVGERDDDPRVPSVVVFTAALGEAIERVREQRARVGERVLVVELAGARATGAALPLIAAGAADVLVAGPDDHAEPDAPDGRGAPVIDRVVARLARWAAIDALLATDAVARTLVGASAAWRRVLRQIVEVARFTDAPILVTGETGTGKELVSRLVHALDARAGKRELVVVDCTTIVPELSGSELFGHEKGSFTGAVAARNGAFALADHGSLFLDEVGELPVLLQAELLRVVQEHTYKRVGGNAWQTTTFRLVCATNRDLMREQRDGRFRADLFYRISGWSFHLPPLRERRDDIPALVRHFLAEPLARPPDIDDAVLDHLARRELRGNIRELRQICARIAHRHVGPGPITLGDLGSDLRDELRGELRDELRDAPGVSARHRAAAGGAAAASAPPGAPAEPPLSIDDLADRVDPAMAAASLDAAGWCDPSFHHSIGKAVAMGVGLKEIGRLAEDIAVQLAVRRENGSLQHAARRLGVTDRALQLRRASARAAATTPPPIAPNGKLE
jgi:transcriptional regulator with GAF, ATPase, and Fis domain